jgi:Trk K+ transport system NAD-binding subunit
MPSERNSTRTGEDRSGAAGTTLVFGGGTVGRCLADALAAGGHRVTFVDAGADVGRGSDAVEVIARDLVDAGAVGRLLADVGPVEAAVVVGPDSETFLLAHALRRKLSGTPIVATVDHPGRRCAFDGLDVDSLETGRVLAAAVTDRLPEPSESARGRHRL